MKCTRQDTIVASTILSIAAATVLVMNLMSASIEGWAQDEPVYVISDSVTPVGGQIDQTDQRNDNTTEEKTLPPSAPLLPEKVINSTSNQVKLPDKIEKELSSFVGSSSGGGSGSGAGGRDDEGSGGRDTRPKPDPKPEPGDEPPRKEIRSSELHGVNFIDHILDGKEGKARQSKNTGYVDGFVAKAKESNFNLFRVPVRWEAYVGNEANFLAQLAYLVKTANENDIAVWIDFHHFDATSNWPSKVSKGGGFPKFVVSCYKPTKDYERDPEVREFWNDYYLNKVRDSSNSCKRTLDVWTLHADFIKDMINKIDRYPNVIGYEILNEPHVWKDADYSHLGEMHTEIAKKLRKSTDKVIIFTRETAHGLEPDGTKYERRPGLENKILAKDPANNVMYAPHLYDLKEIETHVSQWKALQKKWKSMGYDVAIGVGEWSTQPPQLKSPSITQANIDGFVSVWERENWMHTYWAFGGFSYGEGNVLVKSGSDLTLAGKYYAKSIIKHYSD